MVRRASSRRYVLEQSFRPGPLEVRRTSILSRRRAAARSAALPRPDGPSFDNRGDTWPVPRNCRDPSAQAAGRPAAQRTQNRALADALPSGARQTEAPSQSSGNACGVIQVEPAAQLDVKPYAGMGDRDRHGACRFSLGTSLAVPRRLPVQMSYAGRLTFQDQFQLAEVLRYCGLDLGGRERGKKPQRGGGGIEFYLVDKPCRAGRCLQHVSDPCPERPDLPLNGQPPGWLEDGYLEILDAPARDGACLAVPGAHPDRPGGSLAGLFDGVVPHRDVLEVGEERENLLGGSLDRDRVLELLHLSSPMSAAEQARGRGGV